MRRGGAHALALAGLLGVGVSAGCAIAHPDRQPGATEQDATPIDRMLLGQAARYPADHQMRAALPALDGSMQNRRRMAWSIVEKVVAPVGVHAPGPAKVRLPRFATWYSREDFLPMFDHLFGELSDDQKRARGAFTDAQLSAVFPWDAKMAPTLASYTEERYEARLKELGTPAGQHALTGNARVLMSPAYVGHVMKSYAQLTTCTVPDGAAAPPGPTNNAACLPEEFPVDAAAVKARWIPDSIPFPTFDTSAASVKRYLETGAFGDGSGTAKPDEDTAYTMQVTADTKAQLAALHIVTKELRDWTWITLWWSPDPDSDFGADRPASLSRLEGPWRNYKMCVVTGYAEKDATPGAAFAARYPSLAAALEAAASAGPSTWCSNPYLELGAHNARTNCIGCHQHGGTGATTDSILTADADGARAKVRKNFPTDYVFATSTGLELAASMKQTVEALTPPR